MKHLNVQFANVCAFQNDRILEFAHEELIEGLEALLARVVDGELPNDRGALLDYAREVLL